MKTTDRFVNRLLVVLILLHVLAWWLDTRLGQSPLFICMLNLLLSTVFIGWRIAKEMGIRKHYLDRAEITAYFFEVIAAITAGWALHKDPPATAILMVQYAIFFIHLVGLAGFLCFLRLFKIKKLI